MSAPAEGFPFPNIDAVAAPHQEDAAPFRLTASDGTGLRLVAMTGRAVVDAPLAFTELTLVFQNPEDRVLEGNFTTTLPPRASISRFAMKVGESWQEGEIVERQRARQTYEDFLHRKQDPALLEQSAGNAFSARVFPIPARGVKEIVISFSQEISRDAPFALPLRGLPTVGTLDLAVHRAGSAAPLRELRLHDAAPTADLVLDPKELTGGDGLRSGDLVLARVRPLVDAQPDPLASAVILVDTSASRALDLEAELRLVGELAQAVARAGGPSAPLVVAGYDQTIAPIFDGAAGDFGGRELARLRARQALGASDLGRALRFAREHAEPRGARRVVLLTDGVATAGDVDPAALRKAAADLRQAGVERLDAVALGGIRDDGLLRAVVTAGLRRDGVVVDGARGGADVERRLAAATRSGVAVRIDGARWIWPPTLDGVQPGDEALVYADVPAAQPVRITVDGRATPLELTSVERPLLERAWVQAKIGRLLSLEAERGASQERQREIVDLSVAHRVLSPLTALLVLETEHDYARFGIDRRGLTDILTVAGDRVAVVKRSWPPRKAWGAADPRRPAVIAEDRAKPLERAAPQEIPDASAGPSANLGRAAAGASANTARGNMWGDSIRDAFGAGGLGLTGVGEGGGGRGEGIGVGQGRLGGAHRTRPPQIRAGATQVSGRLPPEVIQRIVRQNFGRFRGCYEDGLRRIPNLQGRVAVRFIIGRTGDVTAATDAGSDLPDRRTIDCVTRAFEQLSFPTPEGGVITVVYPLTFSSDDSAAEPPSRDRSSTSPSGAPRPDPSVAAPSAPPPAEEAPPKVDPYTGRFKTVMNALAAGRIDEAMKAAWAWHLEDPGDVTALIALGEGLEAAGDPATAARCYGSLIDLFPSRADMRRFAGERLERVRDGAGLDLSLDTYRKAQRERPDHPSSHRLLAIAHLKRGEHEKAFEAAAAGLARRSPPGRFPGVERILKEDLGLIAAAWIKAAPSRRGEILAKASMAGGAVENAPSIRFVLTWETDANDVDFHIRDDRGDHAYYGAPSLPSGGELYADVTTGYGPECFTIRAPREQRASRYTLEAHYYARGPMGYGMGKLQIIEHDGQGTLTFEERPFLVMADKAFVDLGVVQR